MWQNKIVLKVLLSIGIYVHKDYFPILLVFVRKYNIMCVICVSALLVLLFSFVEKKDLH